MNYRIRALWSPVLLCGLLVACTQQQIPSVAPIAKIKPLPAATPIAKAKPLHAVVPLPVAPKKVVAAKAVQVMPKPVLVPQVLPVPAPYHDLVVTPVSLLPVPTPVVSPAPVIKPAATVVSSIPVVVPEVKTKGVYQGAIPIDNSLRQQYQK